MRATLRVCRAPRCIPGQNLREVVWLLKSESNSGSEPIISWGPVSDLTITAPSTDRAPAMRTVVYCYQRASWRRVLCDAAYYALRPLVDPAMIVASRALGRPVGTPRMRP